MSKARHTRIDCAQYLSVERHDSNGVTVRVEQAGEHHKIARIRLAWWQVQALRDQFAKCASDEAGNMHLRADSIKRQGGAS